MSFNEGKNSTSDDKDFLEEDSSVNVLNWTKELKKQDQKLQDLRSDKEFWFSRCKKEKENGSHAINELKLKIHEKLTELKYSKTEIKKLEDILKQEKVSAERLQYLDQIGAKLKAEEEDLLITVVFMKEELKNYDDVICEKQKLLSQIKEKEKLMSLQEEEFTNKLMHDKLESEKKYNRLKISMDEAISNLICKIQENSKKQLQYVANKKIHKIAAKREKLCTISSIGLKLLKEHLEFSEKVKQMQIEADMDKELTQMLSREIQKSKLDLSSHLDDLVMQQKASASKLENEQTIAAADSIPPDEGLVGPYSLNGYVENSDVQEPILDHEEAILVAEETELNILDDEELPLYKLGNFGLVCDSKRVQSKSRKK